MPIIQSAKKKLRKDAKKTKINQKYKMDYEKVMRSLKKNKDNPSADGEKLKELTKKAYSTLDKAVKKNIFHKNKVARLKSQITKFAKSAK